MPKLPKLVPAERALAAADAASAAATESLPGERRFFLGGGTECCGATLRGSGDETPAGGCGHSIGMSSGFVAPPPADAPPPQAEVLAKLEGLNLCGTQITDEGCAQLASRLRSGALPALEYLRLGGIPASEAARAAVYEAHGWARRARREVNV